MVEVWKPLAPKSAGAGRYCGWGDWEALGGCCFDPSLLGDDELGNGLCSGAAKRRAAGKIGDLGDVSAVLVTVKDIDVVVGHSESPGVISWSSIVRRRCRIRYGLALPAAS